MVLGYIKIRKNKLILETNSENRAKKGRVLLEKYLKGTIGFQKMLIESIGAQLENLLRQNSKLGKPVNELQNSPEVQEMLNEMMK